MAIPIHKNYKCPKCGHRFSGTRTCTGFFYDKGNGNILDIFQKDKNDTPPHPTPFPICPKCGETIDDSTAKMFV